MASASNKIIQLRQLLAERFGQNTALDESVYVTGFSALDAIGVPRGALTEIVSTLSAGPGGSLLLYGLLHAALGRGERVILIDGRTSFAPHSLPQTELNRLVWVRCRDAGQAIKATDLAVRDGNVPLIVAFLALNSMSELRRVSATAWQRLQLVAEKSGVTLLAFMPWAQIGCARLRLSTGGAFPLSRLHVARNELTAGLALQVERRRSARRDDATLRCAVGT